MDLVDGEGELGVGDELGDGFDDVEAGEGAGAAGADFGGEEGVRAEFGEAGEGRGKIGLGGWCE